MAEWEAAGAQNPDPSPKGMGLGGASGRAGERSVATQACEGVIQIISTHFK